MSLRALVALVSLALSGCDHGTVPATRSTPDQTAPAAPPSSVMTPGGY